MNKNAPAFESLARKLAATMKRLAPALAKWDDEDDAAEHMAENIADTLEEILARSNRLANEGVAGFTHFRSYGRLEKYARTLDRRQRGARSGPARTLWEGSWSGNDAERARTLCVFLQKMEKNAPPRSQRPKGITKPLSQVEEKLRDQSVREAVELVVRENRFSHTAVCATADQIHQRLARNGERPPKREYVSKHPEYLRARDAARPQVPRPLNGQTRRQRAEDEKRMAIERAVRLNIYPSKDQALLAYEADSPKFLEALLKVGLASNLPKQ